MSKKEHQGHGELSPAYFEDEMKTSYLNYAYSVITSRAIPDVRDGSKPVHRRILYAMSELALWHDKATRKSARVVGDVLGKYHPHGDSSVYMAAVKMAQGFSMRYPLIVGQGNFGSIDDDPPAAMRYTEMKLSRVAEFMLDDLKKGTVDFRPNFDDTLKEPKVLPGKFPQLLCNGTTGIAVGFATDVPPHNLSEVAKAVAAYIKNPDITVKEIMKYIPGPDFPTHGVITNRKELLDFYENGHGAIELAGKMEYEEKGSHRSLIITEIPYRIVKSKIVEEISNIALDTKNKYNLILRNIKEVKDESSKEGIRVNIILNRDADADAIKSIIYKQTSMRVKIRMNFVVLVDNQPRILSLKDILSHYVEHRREVIIRRTQFDLNKAEKELHILEGLLIALDNIDEVIRIIKSSKDTPSAKSNLMKAFKLSEIQAQAILDMRLQKLTNLETHKLIARKEELVKLITELKSILSSGEKRDKIIIDELAEMIKEIGDERRTRFDTIETTTIGQEELIKNDQMLLTVSKKGFIIREIGGQSLKSGSRKSKGRKGDVTDTDRLETDDFIFATVAGHLKDTILFVSDAGRVYSLKGYEITGANDGKITRAHIRNIERLKSIEKNGEKISAVLLIDEFHKDRFLTFVTKKGKAPRISLDNFNSIHKVGINGVRLNKGDAVASAIVTDGSCELFFLKKNGKGFKIAEPLLPRYSRGAAGANCVSVSGKNEAVIGMGVTDSEHFIVVITRDGKGKKVTFDDFTLRANRGGKGFKVVEIGKNRELADFTECLENDSIVITTRNGRRVSYKVSSLSTNLLKMIDLTRDDEVSSISTISGEEESSDSE